MTSKTEAIVALLGMALGEEDGKKREALTVAAKCLSRAVLHRSRNKASRWQRKQEAARQDEAPAIEGEPPASPSAELMAERVRAVAARMRELDKKAREEKIQMGCFALSMWLEGFATRLDQAVGDDPTPWVPYDEPLRIVHLPKRQKHADEGRPETPGEDAGDEDAERREFFAEAIERGTSSSQSDDPLAGVEFE